jgi:DNA-nicking Smr family endonuclease
MDPLVTAKLRAGQYSPEASMDLHGQNAEQARAALINFIRHAYNKGQRSLVVVTGRGKNSPGGLGVLRKSMQEWLTRNPLKRVVLAFCTAKAKDGGTGAVYILLRKLKKSNGKIQWDRWEA